MIAGRAWYWSYGKENIRMSLNNLTQSSSWSVKTETLQHYVR